MTLFNREDTRLIASLADMSARVNRDQVERIVNLAKSFKPAGYDKHQAKVQKYYDGHQTKELVKVLQARFPRTFQTMDPFAINLFRAAADLDAQAYRARPDRWVEDENGDIDEAATEQLRRLLDSGNAHVVLPEMERRLMAAKTMFIRLQWESKLEAKANRPGRLRMRLFHPQCVHVIPNPAAPGDLWAAHCVVLEMAGDPSGEEAGLVWYEIWRRNGEMGAWVQEHVRSDGKQGSIAFYPTAVLPIVRFTDGLCDDQIFLDIDRDAIEAQDAYNVMLTDFGLSLKLGNHKPKYHIGPDFEPGKKLTVGVNTLTNFPTDSVVGQFENDASMLALEALEKLMQLTAVAKQQNPSAYSHKARPNESAAARKIDGEAASRRATERYELFACTENEDFLPIVVDIGNAFKGAQRVDVPKGGRFRVKHRPVEEETDYEATRALSELLLTARDLNDEALFTAARGKLAKELGVEEKDLPALSLPEPPPPPQPVRLEASDDEEQATEAGSQDGQGQ